VPVLFTRVMLFLWALNRFDVFIMGAGSSFFGLRELPILRTMNKRVIYTLHGTDARPPYIDGFFDPHDYGLSAPAALTGNEDPKDRARRLVEAHSTVVQRRLKLVQDIERYASYVICGPSYAQFLSRPFVNFYAIGLPTEVPTGVKEVPNALACGAALRVLHAPSNTVGKGTADIRRVVAELINRGISIEYEEISGKKNIEVYQAIARSDIVIDQYYSDSPMATFAAEAGALGKPAVVGGYFSQMASEEISDAFLPPSAYCLPNDLADTVASLALNLERREELGLQARRHVREAWAPVKVAERMLQVLNQPPENWIIDPQRLEYILGIGLSEVQARENVAALIRARGVAALGLSHKPELEQRFVSFAMDRSAPNPDKCIQTCKH
jgi:glycosyltransferase involved in cell wall biosynthesis